MSIFFSKSKSLREAWHRELLSNDLAGQFGQGQLGEFPASILQLTNDYLDRKKLLPCTTECEACLTELVKEHVRRDGSPYLALLACIRFYSRSTALAILGLMRRGMTSPWTEQSHGKYLHCLILINKIIPAYVRHDERSIAALLLAIYNTCPEPLLVFRRIVHELAKLPGSLVLPTEYINKVLHFCNIRKSHEAYITRLQSEFRFAELHRFLSWASTVGQPHQCPLAHDVMWEQIPELGAWLTWRPNPKFLVLEASPFTPAQLGRVRSILALEGPDTTPGSQHATLKEASSATLGATSISPAELPLAVELQTLLADAVQLDPLLRPSAIEMVIGLCINLPATSTSLGFATRVLCTRDPECYDTAVIIAVGMAPAAAMATRMDTIVRVLPILFTNPDVSGLYLESIVSAVEPTMVTAQEMYREHLSTGLSHNFGFSLQAYGNAIQRAIWLHQHLDPDFVMKIHRFPPDDVLGGIIGRAQSAPSLPAKTEEAMRQYLLATLCSTGTEDQIAEYKVVVDADLEFWITHPEIERNRVLLAIRDLYAPGETEDPVFLRAFRQQIPHEDIVLLRDMLPLLERNSDVSCGELLHVVARRTQLPVGIHDVWISLALFMLQKRAIGVLDWACDDLPLEPFLSWLDDVQQLAARKPEGDGVALLARIGLVPSRLEWFAKLKGPYFDAASYLDRLQRRASRGSASLKWLYLEEMANVATLMDAIMMDSQLLGYDREWLFSFYDGTIASMSDICRFVQKSQSCSPHGRMAIRIILQRFSSKNLSEWPNRAAVTYAMAWMRSGKLTHADEAALKTLFWVLDLKLAYSIQGVAFLRDKVLRDYDHTMELAHELEDLRTRMSRKDPERANALAARLGMKEVRPYVDAAVPPALSDITECVDGGMYEMCFPLTHLDENDLKVRGISSALPVLTVRVNLAGEDRSRHGFCVHMLPRSHLTGKDGHAEQQQQPQHELCTAGDRPPTSRLCGVTLHMFTHALVQRLWRLFRWGAGFLRVTLQAVHDAVTDTVKRPGAECTACGDALVNLWRPTICTKPACYKQQQQLSLYVRCHSLLMDAPVLDFLLCCLHAATSDTKHPNLKLLTEDCPFDRAALGAVIDSFPPLPASASTGPWQLLRAIREDAGGEQRAILLAWMSKWFRGCLMTAPPGKRLAIMSNVEQFVLLNSTPECEDAFASCMQQQASSSASSPSQVVFHGSQASRMWRVLTEGLRNMSHTAYMRNGALAGPGIYLADEPATSFRYSASLSPAWRHSAFRGRKILLGCELAGSGADGVAVPGYKRPPEGTHIVTDESRVLVRYVFLCPDDYRPPPSRHVRPAMQTTFAALRAGPT